MPPRLTLTAEAWMDLMARSDGDVKARLRQERREGAIQITGLSRTKDAAVKRLKRKAAWRRGGRGA